MPVLPADFVLPTGSLPADWFTTPDIEAWIALGYASVPVGAPEADADAVATYYTYYRGFDARAKVLLGNPDNVGLDGMSVAQSNGRYDRMTKEAEKYRLLWEGAVLALTPVPEPVVQLRVSRSTAAPIAYHWM